jgi:transposase-like protein
MKQAETSGNLASPSDALPARIDREKVFEFLELTLRGGHSYKEAAEIVGITDRTARNWRNSEWWGLARAEAESAMRDEYMSLGLSTLADAARAGNWKAADALLKHVASKSTAAGPSRSTGPVADRYTRTTRPIETEWAEVASVGELSIEELRARAAASSPAHDESEDT